MKGAESRLVDAFIKLPSETVWMWSLLQGHPAAWPDQRSCTLWFWGSGEDPGEESWSLGFYLKHRGEHTQGHDTWQLHLSSQEVLSVDPLEVLWGRKREGGNIKGKVIYLYNLNSLNSNTWPQCGINAVDQWAAIRKTRAGRAADKAPVSVWYNTEHKGMTRLKD